MREDIEHINKSSKVWVRSDKSNNIYQVSPHEYERILNDKITESYKLDHSDTVTQINWDTAKFAQKVNMIDRLGKLEEKSAYILFKDHKKNFPDKKQTRLINPTKSKLGFVSQDGLRLECWVAINITCGKPLWILSIGLGKFKIKRGPLSYNSTS